MFRITGAKGFHIEFENGVTVSVQLGDRNNYDVEIGSESGQLESRDAEVAIWKEDNWITQEYFYDAITDVMGHCSPEEVLGALNWAAAYQE